MVVFAAGFLWVGASLGLLAVAFRSRQYWGTPAATLFTALSGTLGLSSLLLAATLLESALMLLSLPVLYYVVPVLLALFAFEYTGRFNVTSHRRRFLVVAPGIYLLVTFVGFTAAGSLVTGDPIHTVNLPDWYVVTDAASGATEFLLSVALAISFVALLYMMGLLLVATSILVNQVRRYDHLGTSAAAWLAVATAGPWATVMTTDMVGTMTDIDWGYLYLPSALAFALSAVGLALVTERYGLFTVAPAAGTVGAERVLEDLPEPVVVVDYDEQIIRVNPAAERAFDRTADAVGTPIDDLLEYDVPSLRTASAVTIDAADGQRKYEPRVSAMANRQRRLLGHAVVLRDVTDRVVRQQRLQVLNRVLRHNLRNDMNAIRGHARLLSTEGGDPEDIERRIVGTAEDLVSMGERAREIEQMLATPVTDDRSCELAPMVATVIETARTEYDASLSASVPDGIEVSGDPRILRPIVRQLVENAIRHNDRDRPSVTVSATLEDGPLPVVLTVTDDGPGMPENEKAAIDRGRESPLEHGSGLGLWGVKWGVTRIGGALSIRDAEPRGTVVEIRLPRSVPSDGEAASPVDVDTE